MVLITQSELETKLGRTLTSDEASDFLIINAANQSYIERLIGSSLETASESTRYYDGGTRFLKIDPCTNVTAVKTVDVDQSIDNTVDSDDYTVEPINKTLKTMIRSRYGKFYCGWNNISVTAKFSIAGDTDTLNVVKNAMLESLVSEIDNSDSIVKESIEGYSVELAQTATKNSLDSIKYLFPEIM